MGLCFNWFRTSGTSGNLNPQWCQLCTMYCSECGSENSDGAKFCQECGESLSANKSRDKEELDESNNTGQCQKCDSIISLNADKCPNCGYEPASHGIIGSIGVGLSAGASILIGGLILIIWVVAIGTSFSISDAITLSAFFGFILLFPLGILYLAWKKGKKTPTGQQKKSS